MKQEPNWSVADLHFQKESWALELLFPVLEIDHRKPWPTAQPLLDLLWVPSHAARLGRRDWHEPPGQRMVGAI